MELFTNFKLPSLEKYLSTHFADTKKNMILCSYCKKYETGNLRSLARHSNSCKKNIPITDNNDVSSNSDISEPSICEETNTTIVKQPTKSKNKKVNKIHNTETNEKLVSM